MRKEYENMKKHTVKMNRQSKSNLRQTLNKAVHKAAKQGGERTQELLFLGVSQNTHDRHLAMTRQLIDQINASLSSLDDLDTYLLEEEARFQRNRGKN